MAATLDPARPPFANCTTVLVYKGSLRRFRWSRPDQPVHERKLLDPVENFTIYNEVRGELTKLVARTTSSLA